MPWVVERVGESLANTIRFSAKDIQNHRKAQSQRKAKKGKAMTYPKLTLFFEVILANSEHFKGLCSGTIYGSPFPWTIGSGEIGVSTPLILQQEDRKKAIFRNQLLKKKHKLAI